MLRLLFIVQLCCSVVALEAQRRAQLMGEWEVNFQSGDAQLSSRGKAALSKAYESWEKLPIAFFEITGHTDEIGSDSLNDILAQERADAVGKYMIELGVPEEDMFMVAFGELKPKAPNAHATGRASNRRAWLGLYSIDRFRRISGYIENRQSNRPLQGAEVTISFGNEKRNLITDENGYYETSVPDTSDVRIEVFAKGFFFKTVEVSKDIRQEKEVSISLPEVRSGDVYPFNNMHFYGDQAVLLPRSRPELATLLRFMQMNSAIDIEIAGHINGIMYPIGGEPEAKFQLSVDRAKMVYEYLREQGIDPARMRYHGYGNREMKYPSREATSRQQAANRRVEIRIR